MRMQGHSADGDGGKRALGEALVGSDFDIILEDVWDDRVVAAVRLKGHTGHLLVTSPRLYLVFGAEHFVLPEWLPAHSLGLSSSPPPPPPPPSSSAASRAPGRWARGTAHRACMPDSATQAEQALGKSTCKARERGGTLKAWNKHPKA